MTDFMCGLSSGQSVYKTLPLWHASCIVFLVLLLYTCL